MIQNHLYLPSSAWTNYSLFPRKQPPLAPKWWTPNQELKPLSLEFEMFLISILFLFSISLNPAPILRNSFWILFLWVVCIEWIGGGGRRRYNSNLYLPKTPHQWHLQIICSGSPFGVLMTKGGGLFPSQAKPRERERETKVNKYELYFSSKYLCSYIYRWVN